ncbi:signal-regulatory protein beta-1-like [Rhynchocyon petersi]
MMLVSERQHQVPLPSLLLCLLCLLCLLLGLSGVTGQEDLRVTQPGTASVAAGETVTLHCVVSSLSPVGPMVWFRGAGPDRQLIYNFKGGLDHLRLFPRVRNVTDYTKTDNLNFSIRISNITPADTGTYFCVKFRKGSPDTEFKSGPGTQVTVSAKPSGPMVSGPSTRTTPGHTVSFTCKSHGFSPRDVTLKWFKNGNELMTHQEEVVPQGESVSYNISSTAHVKLTRDDVHSQVICEGAHSTLKGFLRGTANLSETIRVPPSLEVTQLPQGNQVNFTCHVKKFYPKNLNMTWLENGNVSPAHATSVLTEDKDGTYNLKSWILVNSCAHRENMVITCQVVHDGQPAVSIKETLKMETPQKNESPDTPSEPSKPKLFLLFGSILLSLKLLLVIGVSAIYVFRKLKV